jgi:hypothetical protein
MAFSRSRLDGDLPFFRVVQSAALTLEEQARITVIAQELRAVLEAAKKRQQEQLRGAS